MNKLIFQAIEKRIRLSKSYHNWVQRNKSPSCISCNKTSFLECHHTINMYQIIYSLWKLYGDKDKVYEHAIAMHDNDKCDSVTLCKDCHSKQHAGRSINNTNQTIVTDSWTTIPRNFNLKFTQSTLNKSKGYLGLIGFQTLLGINWYILNGHLDSRMIVFNRRRFAELIGKTPSTSFNASLIVALKDLQFLGVLNAFHCSNNNVELHISNNYLDILSENPWFIPLNDIKTNKPCVLALKYFLGLQSNKSIYRIALDKLVRHIGIHGKTKQMISRAIKTACNHIKWANVNIKKSMCTFTIQRRGGTPIFSLRQSLQDAIQKGV